MIQNPNKIVEEGIIKMSAFSKIQQNGIDLTLREELILDPGKSKNILLNEEVKLPANLCGELKIRSTYSRQGIFLSSGFWDSGFEGALGCTLYNLSDKTITIPQNERVCQFICLEAESANLYQGQYQNIK
jgi:dCTP deaminase